MKLVVLAAATLPALLGISADSHKQIVGDPMWLATDKCTSPDPEQCALERQLKALLRKGPVRVPG